MLCQSNNFHSQLEHSQVCDLVTNHPFKASVKVQYHRIRSRLIADAAERTDGLARKLKISRDQIIRMCERAVDHINAKQQEKDTIRRCFQKCGQDPTLPEAKSEELLHAHLMKLTQDSLYKALYDHQMALNLVGAADIDEGDEESAVNESVISEELQAAVAAADDVDDEEEDEGDEDIPRSRKKRKPSANVGWSVGDVMKCRWYHEDSRDSPFRGSYYVAKVTEVYTNTQGKKTYTVQYDDNAIEENVKHFHTMAL